MPISITYDEFLKKLEPDDGVLVMFSGGLDSTCVLYRLLAETNCAVVAHHIHLHNHEKRWVPEAIAVDAIRAYVQKHVRHFDYSESTYVSPCRRNIGFDVDIVAFMSAQILYDRPEIQFIAHGQNKDDFREGFDNRFAQAKLINEAALNNLKRKDRLFGVGPCRDMTKKDICDYLPDELLSLTWSCRHPVKQIDDSFARCMKCVACKEMTKYDLLNIAPEKIYIPQ